MQKCICSQILWLQNLPLRTNWTMLKRKKLDPLSSTHSRMWKGMGTCTRADICPVIHLRANIQTIPQVDHQPTCGSQRTISFFSSAHFIIPSYWPHDPLVCIPITNHVSHLVIPKDCKSRHQTKSIY